jgi:hypothetical protein
MSDFPVTPGSAALDSAAHDGAAEATRTDLAATPARFRPDSTTIATALAVISMMTAGAALWSVRDLSRTSDRGRVLVYDELAMPLQVAPYVDAGFDADTIVRQAFDEAVARGHIILRRGDDVSGGDGVLFRISEFIAPPPAPAAGAPDRREVPPEVRGLFEQLPTIPDPTVVDRN